MAMQLYSSTPAPAAATPRSDDSPISKLPDDVLMHIFTLGVELYKWHPDGLTELDFLRRGQEWESDNGPFSTSFQEAVSQVCSGWRRAALGTATLWTTLNASGATPSERLLTYITRSKAAPLDVYVSFIPGRYSWSRVQFPDGEAHLSLLMGALLPHVRRWRMFLFWTNDTMRLSDLVDMLVGVDAAPQLEVLMLDARTPEYTDHTSAPDDSEPMDREAHARDHCRLFSGQIPKLRILSISRAIFSWELSNLLESSLTTLSITQCGHDIGYHMSSGQLTRLLQASMRNLHTLSLEWFQDFQEESWKDAAITLPALTRLLISVVNFSDIQTFMAHVTLPKLQSLALYGNALYGLREQNTYELFTTLSKIPALKNLVHLQLSDVLFSPMGPKATRKTSKFCRKLKSLEILEVTRSITNDRGFRKVWKVEKAFPRVHTLVLRGSRDTLLRNLLETNRGRPLTRIYLSTGGQADDKVSADLITLQAEEEGWGGPKVEFIDLDRPLEPLDYWDFTTEVNSEWDVNSEPNSD